MAKKQTLSDRFQEVARRSREIGPIHTGPSMKAKITVEDKDKPAMTDEDKEAYRTRPGRTDNNITLHPNGRITTGSQNKGDVNLPINTAHSSVKARMAKEESEFRNSIANKYKSQSDVVNRESKRQADEINKRLKKNK